MALTPKQLERVAHRVMRDCLAEAGDDAEAGLQAGEILLSIATDEWLTERWNDLVREQAPMRRLLERLDRELSKQRGVMLSLEEKVKKNNAHLYGVGAVGAIPVTTTEVGRLANILDPETAELFRQPEVGSPGSGALQTAKERAAGKAVRGKKMKGKAKLRAGRERMRRLAAVRKKREQQL